MIRWYHFEGNDEITAHELAIILEACGLKIDQRIYNKLPKWVQVWFNEEMEDEKE